MGQQTTRTIIVKGDPHEVYTLWLDVESFPKFMKPIRDIRKVDDTVSHWKVDGPFGTTIEWDAVTTRQDADKRIAWTSRDGGDIKTSGQVTFTPLPQGETQVTATVHYQPNAGLAAPIFASLFGNLESQLEENLHRFKKHAERELHSAMDDHYSS